MTVRIYGYKLREMITCASKRHEIEAGPNIRAGGVQGRLGDCHTLRNTSGRKKFTGGRGEAYMFLSIGLALSLFHIV